MLEGEVATPNEVRDVAQRVLGIERTILRRAWGILYAVAAIEVVGQGVVPLSIYLLGFTSPIAYTIYLALSTAVSLLALATIVWIFRRIFALRFVRGAISGSLWAKALRPLPAVTIFAVLYAGIVAVAGLFPQDFYTVLFLADVAGLPWFYYGLKVTFPEGLPLEGKITLVASGITSIGQLVIYDSVFVTDAFAYLSLWIGCSVVLVLAFVHTRSATLPEPPKEEPGDW